MANRTISQLTPGTVVWLDENQVHTPYFYLGLDENGNARLLRKYAALAKRMNATNVASYAGCEADLWLENETDGFLSRLDAATINALVQTSISYSDYTLGQEVQIATIARRCFLLSYTEEGWTALAAGSEGKSYLDALKTATGQTGDKAARIGYNEEETAVGVWMRSGFSAAQFRFVHANGLASSSNASSTDSWLRPALSVAPATSVSPEGAESIFLLPEGHKTYWELQATMSMGKTAERAKKAKLTLPHDILSSLSLKMCNNYGDASPVWESAADGQVTTFANDTKTATDWELGVKIEAQAPVPGRHVSEPIAIVELDEA